MIELCKLALAKPDCQNLGLSRLVGVTVLSVSV